MQKAVGFFKDKKDDKIKPILKKKPKSTYRGQTQESFWKNSSIQDVRSVHSKRTPRARQIDSSLKAPIAETNKEWIKQPNRRDIKGIDYPELKKKKTKKSKPKSVGVATYNKATGWINLEFPDKPSKEIRDKMKAQGFRYLPRNKRWRAKWSTYREDFSKELMGDIKAIDIEPNYVRKAEDAQAQANKHSERSNEYYQQFRKELKTIPMGQPILVGHHSEKGHRAHLKRLDKKMEISIREKEIAKKYDEKAKRMTRKARGESPGLIYRRIQRLEAKERKFKRNIKEIERKEELVKKLGKTKAEKLIHISSNQEANKRHWNRWLEKTRETLTRERKKYTASGGIAIEKQKLKLKKGDLVRTRFGIRKIVRVNPKTITTTNTDGTWKLKLDHSDIKGIFKP